MNFEGMDDRAQSIGIARFFLSLVGGAIMFWVVSIATDPLFEEAHNTGPNVEATTWLETIVNNLPIVFLLLAFFGLIALAIFQREMLR